MLLAIPATAGDADGMEEAAKGGVGAVLGMAAETLGLMSSPLAPASTGCRLLLLLLLPLSCVGPREAAGPAADAWSGAR